jgi:hypothetical protein
LIRAQRGDLASSTGSTVFPETIWTRLQDAPLVVLDEPGCRTQVNDFHYETVKRVIDCRYGLPLIVISNHGLDEIARLYDDRVASRLAAGTVVKLEGADRRLAKT